MVAGKESNTSFALTLVHPTTKALQRTLPKKLIKQLRKVFRVNLRVRLNLLIKPRTDAIAQPMERTLVRDLRRALALAADMDRSYLGRLERGEKQPSLDVLFRVAAALQIDAHKLVARVAKVVEAVG